MKEFASGQTGRYLFAIVVVVAATGVRLAVDPILGSRFPYAVLLIGVLGAAFIGRLWGGLLALGLSAVIGNFLFVEPRYSLGLKSPSDTLTLILFLVAGILGSFITDYVSRTRERLRESADEQAARDAQVRNERARLQDIIDSIPGVVWESWGKPDSSQQRIDYVSTYVEKLVG